MTSSQPAARIRTSVLEAYGRGARGAGEDSDLDLGIFERSTYLCYP